MSGTQDGDGRLRQPPVADVTRLDGAVVVRLQGELDLYNAHEVRQALADAAEEAPERLIVDLAAVEFVDSTALGVFVEGRARLANRRAFLLAAPAAETRRALEVSGLDRQLSVHDSVDGALATTL
jgi:anti-sigma B factor antagonist